MFSGCKDCQTSADVHDVSEFGLPDADGAGGACTNALLLTLVSLINLLAKWVFAMKKKTGAVLLVTRFERGQRHSRQSPFKKDPSPDVMKAKCEKAATTAAILSRTLYQTIDRQFVCRLFRIPSRERREPSVYEAF